MIRLLLEAILDPEGSYVSSKRSGRLSEMVPCVIGMNVEMVQADSIVSREFIDRPEGQSRYRLTPEIYLVLPREDVTRPNLNDSSPGMILIGIGAEITVQGNLGESKMTPAVTRTKSHPAISEPSQDLSVLCVP